MGNCLGHEDDRNATGVDNAGADNAACALLGTGLSSRVELSLRCINLENMDTLSLSDPFVVVSLMDYNGGPSKELGRTEIIANELNPIFVKPILVTYVFEEVQCLQFQVFDMDSSFKSNETKHVDLSKQDFIGECSCTLADIVGNRHGEKRMFLTKGGINKKSEIVVSSEELSGQNDLVQIGFSASGLPRMDFMGKSDPFLKIYRVNENGTNTAVFKTEVVIQNLNPVWKPINVGLQQLCNGDRFRPLLIECYDWDRVGTHDYIGCCKTSLEDLVRLGGSKGQITFVNKKGKDVGMLQVDSAQVVPRPSFLDFIRGGCEINFTVAIDFTASNGDPRDLRSLHYMDPRGRPNDYVQAIRAVGQVLEYYDTDKLFPVYGFGGRLDTSQPADHCFALNGNEANPEVEGIAGVENCYLQALSRYKLAGPTIFSQIINEAAAKCQGLCTQQEQGYSVLLIITDGVINDMDNTISAIVSASSLPLSILIVGVGNADFEAMDVLDGDDERLHNSSGIAERDIVQFVPLRQFQVQNMVDTQFSHAIAEALLEEIPGQLLSYMESARITPNPVTPSAQ